MNKDIDYTGMQFNKMLVIKPVSPKFGSWICRCECGNYRTIERRRLEQNTLKYCGECSLNAFELNENKYVGYTQQGYPFCFDTDDYGAISKHTWRKSKGGYFVCTINKSTVNLHRFILSLDDDIFVVDHIDGNKSNNCKVNLRICTKQQNSFNSKRRKNNTSKVAGVWYDTSRDKWCAELQLNGKKYFHKRFNTYREAVEARYNIEHAIHKDFRNTQNDEYIKKIIK